MHRSLRSAGCLSFESSENTPNIKLVELDNVV